VVKSEAMDTREQLHELVTLTQLYITKELKDNSWLICDDPLTYQYFKEFAISSRQPKSKIEQKDIPFVPPPKPTPIKQVTVSEALVKQNIVRQEVKAQPVPKLQSPPEPSVSKSEPIAKTDPFSLQFQSKPETYNHAELQKLLIEKFPNIKIIEEIPDDTEGKRKANQWKNSPMVVLISAAVKNKEQQDFLANVSSALQVRNCLTTFIEGAKLHLTLNPSVRLVLADRQSLANFPDLQKHYRWDSKQCRHFINSTPLIILEELSQYMNNPKQKKDLWNGLRSILNL
jgi:hypothetical protein